MKIIIAPNSFKESLSATMVAHAIEIGFRSEFPSAEIVLVPMADGGEGSLEALNLHLEGVMHQIQVKDPLGHPVTAYFKMLSDQKTAIIEMAEASGLSRVPVDQRQILIQNTTGTGDLILEALSLGARKFIICLGGSATCDGGIGALSALGCVFKNHKGLILDPIPKNLSQISQIENHMDPRLKESEFILAHDVNNPLLGLEGALMYAPQKGAHPEEVELLHKGLENYAYVLEKTTQKEIAMLPGAGAAGGLGAGLYAFLNAFFMEGAAFIIHSVGLEKKLKNASLVVTAEGQIDEQSSRGKTPIAIAKLAKKYHVPVIAIVGNLGKNYEEVYPQGMDAVFSIAPGPISLDDSKNMAKPLLSQTANNIARLLKISEKFKPEKDTHENPQRLKKK